MAFPNKPAGPPRRAVVPAALLASALAAAPCSAGSVSGPYLIYFNFPDDRSADSALHDYTNAVFYDKASCWNDEAMLLIGAYPPAITKDLVRRALVQHDHAAARKLAALLKKGDAPDVDDPIRGYDGIVAVLPGPRPTLSSLGADGRIRTRIAPLKDGHPDWPEAFCAVQPPIRRKP